MSGPITGFLKAICISLSRRSEYFKYTDHSYEQQLETLKQDLKNLIETAKELLGKIDEST